MNKSQHEPDARSYNEPGRGQAPPLPYYQTICEAPYRVGAGLAPALEGDGHCITCSDEAVTVQVLRIDFQTGIALVTVQDKIEEVDITLVEEVVPGDWLLVHGGVAIANVATDSPSDAGEASDA